MQKKIFTLLALLTLNGVTGSLSAATPNQVASTSEMTGQPITGKVMRNRVRMRSGPDLNSPILRELDQGSLITIVGEKEGFYAVRPPRDIKGYIYRTYILDNKIDGEHVNVRLEPTLEAPIIAQLNKGESVHGELSASNSKWLEIVLPDSVHFYVAKDFVERLGAAIPISPSLSAELPHQDVTPIHDPIPMPNYSAPRVTTEEPPQERQSVWLPQESHLYDAWAAEHPGGSIEDFYAAERQEAVQMRGIIQPYSRPVKNKPGNYMLIGHEDNHPMAFLYSTKIDLQKSVGDVVTVIAVPRPNNHFAFPAFFVMEVQ